MSKDILDEIQYPHIPGAKERRNVRNANLSKDEDDEPDDEEPTDDTEMEEGQYVESEEDPEEMENQWEF